MYSSYKVPEKFWRGFVPSSSIRTKMIPEEIWKYWFSIFPQVFCSKRGFCDATCFGGMISSTGTKKKKQRVKNFVEKTKNAKNGLANFRKIRKLYSESSLESRFPGRVHPDGTSWTQRFLDSTNGYLVAQPKIKLTRSINGFFHPGFSSRTGSMGLGIFIYIWRNFYCKCR